MKKKYRNLLCGTQENINLIYPVYQNTEKQHAYLYTKQMYTD